MVWAVHLMGTWEGSDQCSCAIQAVVQNRPLQSAVCQLYSAIVCKAFSLCIQVYWLGALGTKMCPRLHALPLPVPMADGASGGMPSLVTGKRMCMELVAAGQRAWGQRCDVPLFGMGNAHMRLCHGSLGVVGRAAARAAQS